MLPSILTQRTKRARIVFLAIWGAVALGALFFARGVLLPFILGLVVAYVLTPAVRWVESMRWRARPRCAGWKRAPQEGKSGRYMRCW